MAHSTLRRAALLCLCLGATLGASCALPISRNTPDPDPVEAKPPPVKADSRQAQDRFDAGRAALEAGKYARAAELLRMVEQDHGQDTIAPTTQLYLARAELGAVTLGEDGTLSSTASPETLGRVYQRLKALGDRPQLDPQLRWSARLYAALVLTLQKRQDALAELKGYPSAAISKLALKQDRVVLWTLLHAALWRSGRVLVATLAAQQLHTHARDQLASKLATQTERDAAEVIRSGDVYRMGANTPEHALMELARARAFAGARSGKIPREQLEMDLLHARGPLLRAAAGWALLHTNKKLNARPDAQTSLTDAEHAALAGLARQTSAALLAIGEPGRVRELSALMATAQTKRQLIIAAVVPLSGRYRAVGERALRGVLLASETFEATRRGAVTVVVRDAAEDPAKTVAALKKLGALAIIGPITSARIAAYQPAALQHGLPMITLGANQRKATPQAKGPAMVMRNFATATDEAKAVARAAAQRGDRRAVVLVPNIGYGKLMADAFTKAFTAQGGSVTRIPYQRKKRDDAALAKRVAAKRPQALFIPDTADQVSLIATALARAGVWGVSTTKKAGKEGPRWRVHYLGTSIWQHPRLLQLGASYVEGALIPVWRSEAFRDARSVAFHRSFRETFQHAPDDYAAFAHDTTLALRDAMLRQHARTPEAIARTLQGPGTFDGVTGRVRWEAWGEAQRGVRFITVKGRSFAPQRITPPRPPASSTTPTPPR